MYDTGEKVVCVDAKFEPLHKHIYKALPVEGTVYTVRECSIGRSKSGVSYRVLLEELVNGPDPYMHESNAEELGFRSDRFAPMVTNEAEEEEEMALPDAIGAPAW